MSAQGHDELADATTRTADISNVVGSLWTLHDQELNFRKSIDDAQRVLIGTRFNVNFQAQQLQDAMRSDEADATATLRSADRLLKGGDALASVTDDFGKGATPADKLKIVKDRLPDIAKAQRSIELAIPQNQKSMVTSLAGTIKDLTTLVNGVDAAAATDQTVTDVGRLLSRFRQMSTYTQLAATQMMRKATTTFVEIDTRIVRPIPFSKTFVASKHRSIRCSSCSANSSPTPARTTSFVSARKSPSSART